MLGSGEALILYLSALPGLPKYIAVAVNTTLRAGHERPDGPSVCRPSSACLMTASSCGIEYSRSKSAPTTYTHVECHSVTLRRRDLSRSVHRTAHMSACKTRDETRTVSIECTQMPKARHEKCSRRRDLFGGEQHSRSWPFERRQLLRLPRLFRLRRPPFCPLNTRQRSGRPLPPHRRSWCSSFVNSNLELICEKVFRCLKSRTKLLHIAPTSRFCQ